MKKILFTFLCIVLSFNSQAQLGGSIIYQPVKVPTLPPVTNSIPHSSFMDDFYKAQKRTAEIEILHQKKKLLQQQNEILNQKKNQSDNDSSLKFELQHVNVADKDLKLTEWQELNVPSYITVNSKTIDINGDGVKVTLTIKNIEGSDEDKSSFIYTKEGPMLQIVPIEKNVFMLVLRTDSQSLAYAGVLL